MTTTLDVEDLEVTTAAGAVISSLPELQVQPGRAVALVGESGSGKSTVLLAIQGLLDPSLRATGKVLLDGRDVLGLSENEKQRIRGSALGLVLQSPQASLPPSTRLGKLAHSVLGLHSVDKAERRARMEDSLRSVRLAPEILDRFAHQISGGQAQRFAIALLLALRTPLLLADEPTSALDLTVQAEIVDLLRNLIAQERIGVVIVSHDLPLVSTFADQIYVLDRGVTVDSGTPRYIFTESVIEYTRSLVAAVPRANVSAAVPPARSLDAREGVDA